MRGQIALLLLVSALSSALKVENPQYLITSPYIYRAGEEEEVTVHLIGSKSCEVNVTLKPQRNKEIVASARGIFMPNERGTLKLKIPKEKVKTGSYYWRTYFDLAATVCGVKTESKTVYARERNQHNIFIQTDKGIYKPGQKIRMRIISLDKDFRPKGNKIETVRVTASASRIKQWVNVTLEDGIATLELQLSKEPVLGTYTILAIVGVSLLFKPYYLLLYSFQKRYASRYE